MKSSDRLWKVQPRCAVLAAALISGLLVAGTQTVADELPNADSSASSTPSGAEASIPKKRTPAAEAGAAQKTTPSDADQPPTERVPHTGTQGRIVIEDADGRRLEYALPMEMLPFNPDTEGLGGASEQPRCMIGVICQQPDRALRQHLKLGQRGLLVTAVSAGLPADTAGIQEGDLLLKAGDKDLTSVQDLMDAVAAAGEKPLTILRLHQGEPVEVEVVPCKATDQDAFASLAADCQAESMAEFLKRLPLSDAERKAFQIRPSGQTPTLQRFFGPALEFRDTADLDRNMAGLMREAESSRATKPQPTSPPTTDADSKSQQQEIAELRQLVRELSQRVQKLEAGEVKD